MKACLDHITLLVPYMTKVVGNLVEYLPKFYSSMASHYRCSTLRAIFSLTSFS
jgi:hypothetical protein